MNPLRFLVRTSVLVALAPTALAWQKTSQASRPELPDSSLFGAAVSSADVNGDGFGDVIVGQPLYDDMAGGEGRVLVYHGSALGLAARPSWTRTGEVGALFGAALAGVGDVNGDGFDDVVIGAPLAGRGGRTSLYLGSPTGLRSEPLIEHGGSELLEQFGIAVAAAGDVNGDGYADFAVGATGTGADFGSVSVFHGTPDGPGLAPDWRVLGTQSRARFGRAVSGASDVDGDGFDDLVIGASDFGPQKRGQVWIHHGSAAGLAAAAASIVTVTQPVSLGGNDLGFAVAGIGDFDGDGYGDVLASDPFCASQDTAHGQSQPEGGKIYFLRGSATGVQAPIVHQWGALGGERWGIALARAGDVNGDGRSDDVFAAELRFSSSNAEGAAVVRGAATSQTYLRGSQAGALLGYSVSSAGDVDGDGFDDVIIGEPRFDASGVDDGRVHVHRGSPTGIQSRAAWTLVPPRAPR